MNPEVVTVPVAFIAGLLSFANPCVLPLVPAYLGYLGGQATAEGVEQSRWRILGHGFFFVIGFSAVFVALGAAATAIGQLAGGLQPVLTALGGVMVLLMGLNQLGIVRIPVFSADTRHRFQAQRQFGYLSSTLMGVFFGAGYSPCIGASLTAILSLAASDESVAQGAGLLLVYSLGLGFPLLVMALLIDRIAPHLANAGRLVRAVSLITGVLLVVVGAVILVNSIDALLV